MNDRQLLLLYCFATTAPRGCYEGVLLLSLTELVYQKGVKFRIQTWYEL